MIRVTVDVRVDPGWQWWDFIIINLFRHVFVFFSLFIVDYELYV